MSRCPSREQLARLLAKELAGSEADALIAHVQTCAPCRHVLDELSAAGFPDTARSSPGDGHTDHLGPAASLPRHPRQAFPSTSIRDGRDTDDLPPAPREESWPAVTGYEVLEELGRGGMGVVYKARHAKLGRVVALKMLLGGAFAGPQDRARFRREAEAAARLQHPHIVQIFEVGDEKGCPYLALEYVEGGSLDQHLHGTPLPAQEAARLIGILARAVHEAHGRGIIHRDLKPANILLQMQNAECRMQNENPRSNSAFCILHSAFWIPKVTDFGLAKCLDAATVVTQSGAVLGTPDYMAPEQAGGSSKEVGPAADVYALGAILYYVLTGRPPFLAATALDTLLRVRSEDPVPPAVLQPKVPRDLQTICLKCLRKSPARRYQRAADLADDLERFLAGEPVRARPTPALEQAAKWMKRRPASAALIGAGVLVLALAAGGWLWIAGERAARRAGTWRAVNLALGKAEQLRDQAKQMKAANPADAAAALAVWKQSLTAAEQADSTRAAGLADAETALHVSQLLDEVRKGAHAAELARDQARRDAQMLAQLDKARMARIAWHGEDYDYAASARRYAAAFSRYGLDVRRRKPSAVAKVLRDMPAPMRRALLVGLDDWFMCTKENALRQRISDIEDRIGDDPWWRRCQQTRDLETLKRFAVEARGKSLSPVRLDLLAEILWARGARAEGVALFRWAQHRFPGDFWLNLHLGNSLPKEEGIGYLRAAVALRPQNAPARLDLGTALWSKGDLDGAIEEVRQAIALGPELVYAHTTLGELLRVKGQVGEAIQVLQRAIALGPKNPRAYYNLGLAFRAKGDLDRAIKLYRRAIALDPVFAEAHCNLGFALGLQGRFDESLAAYRRGHESSRRRSDWKYPSAQWVKKAEQLAELDKKLPAVLSGNLQSRNPDEALDLAGICRLKKLFVAAVRLSRGAFAKKPKLADDLGSGSRYAAAAAAVQAGCGQGEDAQALDARGRARFRKQGLEWLQADLALRSRQAETGKPADQKAERRKLGFWLRDPDLAGVRDEKALAALPAEEQRAFRALWAKVASVLGRSKRK
jgi:serine/threonine-protein kinase